MRGRNPLLQGSVAEHLRLGYVGTAYEIAISLNSKDKLYHLHGICGVFQRPVSSDSRYKIATIYKLVAMPSQNKEQ